jgi:hypothetical protein
MKQSFSILCIAAFALTALFATSDAARIQAGRRRRS